MNRLLLALLSGAAFVSMLASACGGGGGEAEGNGDAEELQRIRDDAALAEPAELEALLLEALEIAERNPSDPIGQEAFDFAEEMVVERRVWAVKFLDATPEPPPEVDAGFGAYRMLAGFIAAAPSPYNPVLAAEKLHARLMFVADLRLLELDWARNNRVRWAAALTTEGTIPGSWSNLVAIFEGGTGGMGNMSVEQWAEELAEVSYWRLIAAASGEPQEFLDAWDQLIAAVELATFEPPDMGTEYRDGESVTLYSEEAVTAGAENAAALTAIIDPLRVIFPRPEE
jgi:hypothetical protein